MNHIFNLEKTNVARWCHSLRYSSRTRMDRLVHKRYSWITKQMIIFYTLQWLVKIVSYSSEITHKTVSHKKTLIILPCSFITLALSIFLRTLAITFFDSESAHIFNFNTLIIVIHYHLYWNWTDIYSL